MDNTFLPTGYVKPATKSSYFQPSKLAEGQHKFRILSTTIIGWLDWGTDDSGKPKPIRTKQRPERSVDPTKPAKHFWAFIVWDYADNEVKIMEITQASLQESIFEYHNSQWGDPRGYDLIITRKGQKMETKYGIIPCPPTPLSEEIKAEYTKANIDLNKLFTNEDPFNNAKTDESKAFVDELEQQRLREEENVKQIIDDFRNSDVDTNMFSPANIK